MQAVEIPAAHQRPGPQGTQQGQLLFNGWQAWVQAQAVGGAGLAQHLDQRRGQQFRVAHFHRQYAIGRQRFQVWQRQQHAAQARQHIFQLLGLQQRRRQRAELEY